MTGELGHLGATISLNIDPFQRSIKTLEAQQKALKASMRNLDSSYKATGANVQSLSIKQRILTAQSRSQAEIVRRLKQDYDQKAVALKANSNATEKDIQEVTKAEQKYSLASSKLADMNRALKANEKALKLQSSFFYQSGIKMDAFGKRLQSAGDKITNVGKNMSMKFTAPVAAGLAISSRNAINFSSEIQKMSALLDDGNVSSGELKKQLGGLGDASKKWSTQYGISTNAINTGMEEIIKKGYSYQQTLGAMPSIMDASVASGEDFNTVMNASTSILEQFGLKVSDTQGTLKNTQRVTDSLTFVANKTAAGFSDMGTAMEYAGPVSHALGISLEETASAIGLMSNNGIEGEKAGTALRGALTRLMKPSKSNIIGFKQLGINVNDFKKGALDLPTVIDKIKNNTKGWTKESRASAIALAFGTEAQTGMNVLVNQGGDAMRNLTKETKNATGYTKGIADTMNNTSQNKVKRFKESLNVLSITVGEKLLPTITPFVEKATEIIKQFANMNESTQKSIIKYIALAAAVGPAVTMLGSFTRSAGTLISVLGKTGKGIGTLASMLSKSTPAAKLAENGLKGIGTAALGAGEGAGTFAALLNPVTLGVVGVGAALVGGYAAWKIWGEKAVASAERTKKWGTDVSTEADGALSKFKNFSDNAGNALNDFTTNTKTNTKEVTDAVKGMVKEIDKAGDETLKKQKEALKGLPAEVVKAGETEQKKTKEQNDRRVKLAENAQNTIINILKKHNGDRSKLTDEEYEMVYNSELDLRNMQLNAMDLTGKKKKAIMQTMNNDYASMTQEQRASALDTLEKSFSDEYAKYLKQQEKIKKADNYSKTAKKAMLKELESEFQQSQRSILESQIKITNTSTKTYGQDIERIKKSCKEAGLSYRDLVEDVDKQAQIAAKSNTILAKSSSDMSDDVVEANQRWNSLVFDPKTGELKTNAKEEIQKASQSKDGWNNLKFIMQNANLSTNAKATMAYALMENGKWNSLSFKEQEMLTVYDPSVVKNALVSIGQWDKLTPKQQKLLMDSNTPAQVENALKEIGLWNKIPNPLKKYIRADNHVLIQAVNTSGDAIVQYNNKKISLKKLLANNSDVVRKLKNGEDVIVEYNGKKVNLKKLFGDNDNLLNKLNSALAQILNYNRNNPNHKHFGADTNAGDIIGPVNGAKTSWEQLSALKPELYFKAHYSAEGSAQAVGTNYFSGGSAILGDAAKREPFLTPNGYFGISPNTDTHMVLPRGTRIWSSIARFNAHQSFKNTRSVRALSSVGEKLKSKSGNLIENTFAPVFNTKADSEDLKKQTSMLEQNNKKQDEIIQLLIKLVAKDLVIDNKALEQNVSKNSAARYLTETYGMEGI